MLDYYRDMYIDHTTRQESFYNRICQTENGEIYAVAGKEHSSVCRIEGLETVRRMPPMQFEVTSSNISDLPPVVIPKPPASSPVLYLHVAAQPPVLDGVLAEWDTAGFVEIGTETRGALTVCGNMLYAAYRTADKNLLENGGGLNGSINTIFKTGGALDLFMDTDSFSTTPIPVSHRLRQDPYEGDIRLIVTKVNGQTKAVLFQPVVPGTPDGQKIKYESAIGLVYIDKITDISGQVQLAAGNDGYEYAVPLEAIGFDPQKFVDRAQGMADIGILRGNAGVTVERLYWKNRNTLLVSDLPAEAKFQPNQWGLIRCKADPGAGPGTSVSPHAGGPDSQHPAIAVANGVFHFADAAGQQTLVVVRSLDGRQIYRGKTGAVCMPLPGSLARGAYIVEIITGLTECMRAKIMIPDK
jgi:hypothetical protein